MTENQNYPSLANQGKNLVKFSYKLFKHIQEVSLSEDKKTLLVSDEIYNNRIEICKTCEKYDKIQNRCKECGCFLSGKARFVFEECPLKKWGMTEEDWEETFNNLMEEIDENDSKN